MYLCYITIYIPKCVPHQLVLRWEPLFVWYYEQSWWTYFKYTIVSPWPKRTPTCYFAFSNQNFLSTAALWPGLQKCLFSGEAKFKQAKFPTTDYMFLCTRIRQKFLPISKISLKYKKFPCSELPYSTFPPPLVSIATKHYTSYPMMRVNAILHLKIVWFKCAWVSQVARVWVHIVNDHPNCVKYSNWSMCRILSPSWNKIA